MSALRPHKSSYWLFPKIVCWNKFVIRVALICDLILGVTLKQFENQQVISVDEKTGIQAISRLEDRSSDSKGRYKRREYEYKRNGTTCLIGGFDVRTGKIVTYTLGKERKENDFLIFIQNLVACYSPKDKIIILADQLNTHKSASLVFFVAALIGFEGDLGIKGKNGILKNMKTRKDFLEKEEHRVRFIYTPKHCSWLNPIENWFAKLQRQRLNKANFFSVEMLEEKIRKYIEYYNECLAMPLNWKFKGFQKDKKLHNFQVSNT